MPALSHLRYESGTKTIRTTPGNHWVATVDSWDGTIKPDLERYARAMAAGPALLDFVEMVRAGNTEIEQLESLAADLLAAHGAT